MTVPKIFGQDQQAVDIKPERDVIGKQQLKLCGVGRSGGCDRKKIEQHPAARWRHSGRPYPFDTMKLYAAQATFKDRRAGIALHPRQGG